MIMHTGLLIKMRTQHVEMVEYFLPFDGEEIKMNDLIGKKITMEHSGEIYCIKCGRKTKTSFAQGYCYPCFKTAPETEECVLRPELCRAHEGIARDMVFAQQHCLIEHVVYMAVSSHVKVGVTRNTQIPARWIDQGASYAIELARTPNRHTAGLMEVALKNHLPDKTNWRKMLMGEVLRGFNLQEQKHKLSSSIPSELKQYITPSDKITAINYPVNIYPTKVASLNLDKQPLVQGLLAGIKGQYLIFESGQVINIRKYSGYKVTLSYS
jgi:hypothetical protein